MSREYLTGVVLAAGEASRMPNKALLPLTDGRLAIESSIDWLLNAVRVERIVIVVSAGVSGDIIIAALSNRYSSGGVIKPKFVRQPRPCGVPDAISRVAPLLSEVKDAGVVVTFCDNIYDSTIFDEKAWNSASTTYAGLNANDQLDYWDVNKKEWCPRDASVSKKKELFTGYAVLSRTAAEQGMPGETLVQYFNRLKIGRHRLTTTSGQDYDWHDIGTIAGYARYLGIKTDAGYIRTTDIVNEEDEFDT